MRDDVTMVFAFRMKHILRFVLLVASVTLWAVVFTFLNAQMLHVDEALLLLAAIVVGVGQTVGLVAILHV